MLKRLTAPLRHYFNSRFSAIHEGVVHDHALLEGVIGATGRLDDQLHDSLGLVGRSLDELGSKIELLVEGTSSSRTDEEFLASAAAAFAYRELSAVAATGRVLCAGSGADRAAAVLTALGYDVTTAAAEPARPPAPFDAVVHLAADGGTTSLDGDALLQLLRTASGAATRLVVAARGAAAAGQEEKRLAELLPEWEVVNRILLTRTSPGCWEAATSTWDLSGEHCLLLSADRVAARA